jgi:flagellar L-ring protein precursor FlgH
MVPKFPSRLARMTVLALAATALSACNLLSRIDEIGSPPPLSAIENPVQVAGYTPISLPMPRPEPMARRANSLWRPGARAFFKDQRASRVGDILTVNIDIADAASISNTSKRSRQGSENANLTNFFGVESELGKLLPDGISPSNVVNFGSSTSNTGTGSVNRNEVINLVVAALITQVLPNGNLVIQGRQEVRVNFEVRELRITGVVRPEDISSSNTIQHTQIAEARIAYGGRGQITDMQQPRYGQQLFDIVMPF